MKENLKSFFVKLVAISIAVIIIVNLIFNILLGERLEKIDKIMSLSDSTSRKEFKKKIRSELNKGKCNMKEFVKLTIENGIGEADAFVKSNEVWASVLKSLENWMSERCIRQLKQGSETEMVLWLEHMTTKGLEKTSLTLLKGKLKSALDNLKRKIKKSEDAKAKREQKSKKEGGKKK